MKKSFKEKVLAVVAKIPRGEVLSYGRVAEKAGNPKATRAVGAIMRANHNPKIPCHRVIAAKGMLGGYNGGLENKVQRLQNEGVCIGRRGKYIFIVS
jgi:O-6-methylguanine DNA methyltransferase